MPYITWKTKNTEYRVASLPLGKPDQPQNQSLTTIFHISSEFKVTTARPQQGEQ